MSETWLPWASEPLDGVTDSQAGVLCATMVKLVGSPSFRRTTVVCCGVVEPKLVENEKLDWLTLRIGVVGITVSCTVTDFGTQGCAVQDTTRMPFCCPGESPVESTLRVNSAVVLPEPGVTVSQEPPD